MPDSAAEQARELGEPLATMIAENPAKWGFVGGIACFVISVAIFIGSMSMFLAKIDDPKKKANNDKGKWVTLVFSIVMLGLGVGSIVLYRITPPEAKMWLCPGGLIWERGGKVRFCRWHEVEKFRHAVLRIRYSGGGIGERCAFGLTMPGGEEIGFMSGGNSNERTFGDRLHHEATQAVLPRLAKRLRAGEELDFDALRMDERDLIIGGRRLPWNRVADLELEQGVFQVRMRGGDVAAAVTYSEVSYPLVFHVLARERIDTEMERR